MIRTSDAILLLPLTVLLPPLIAHNQTESAMADAVGQLHASPADTAPLADGFDWPIGRPDARGYYDAQPFGENRHLGEDWNANTGANTDLGDPVFAIGHGVVTFAGHVPGGWGNIVRVVHTWEEDGQQKQVESFYAHLDEFFVTEGEIVRRGGRIGTIGDADGRYYAHLHLELRDRVGMPHGPGYSQVTDGWISPSEFIRDHRSIPAGRVRTTLAEAAP